MKDKISLYRKSIHKFINENVNKYMIDKYLNKLVISDHIISIVALTIISNINKKSKKTLHGYYVALIIELLLLDEFLNVKNTMNIIRLIDDNILLLVSTLSPEKIININCQCHKILYDKINELIVTQGEDKIICISKVAILLAWVLGCGLLNKEILNELEIAGNCLGKLICISNTFVKENYESMFDEFIKYKQKFIEIAVTYNIFSDTMKNIINSFEDKIDKIAC